MAESRSRSHKTARGSYVPANSTSAFCPLPSDFPGWRYTAVLVSGAAAIGFRSKTGRAIAVAVAGPPKAPELLWRREIALIDPAIPETAEPYHQVMELPWEQAIVAVRPSVARIESVARTALASLIRELASGGWTVRAVGVVGSPDRSLQKIGNEHIRAHAAEGILFRRVLESAAEHHHLKWVGLSEEQIGPASLELGAVADVAAHLKALGRQAGAPWRVDERAAATAAWLALVSGQG